MAGVKQRSFTYESKWRQRSLEDFLKKEYKLASMESLRALKGVSINGVKVMLADDNKFYKVSDIDVSGKPKKKEAGPSRWKTAAKTKFWSMRFGFPISIMESGLMACIQFLI